LNAVIPENSNKHFSGLLKKIFHARLTLSGISGSSNSFVKEKTHNTTGRKLLFYFLKMFLISAKIPARGSSSTSDPLENYG
jgi:hypothetical protein